MLSTSLILTAWLAGGLLALLGALCYAELTTTYPEPGGDYVYLTRAYGSRVGFLFVWAEFWIIRPGSTGPMAFVFGEYFKQLLPLGTGYDTLVYAVLAIVGITLLNMLGVRAGKWTQNLLTVIKVLALLGVSILGALKRGSLEQDLLIGALRIAAAYFAAMGYVSTLTQDIDSGETLGLSLHDHVVVSHGGHRTFKEVGLLLGGAARSTNPWPGLGVAFTLPPTKTSQRRSPWTMTSSTCRFASSSRMSA